MAGKTAGRKGGRKSKGLDGESTGPQTVKVTMRLTVETAQRLGVESAMRRVPQSQIVEEVLAPYLKRWRLPSTIDATAGQDASGPGQAGNAA